MPTGYSFTRMPDKAVLALFQELAGLVPAGKVNLVLSEDITFEFAASPWGMSPDLTSMLGSGAFLIQYMHLWRPVENGGSGPSIEYRRTHQFNNDRLNRSENPFIDGLQLNRLNQGGNGLAILATISKHLKMAPPMPKDGKGGDMLIQADDILNRVSAAAAEIAAQTAARHRELDEAQRRLEEAAEATLARDREVLNQEVQAQRDALDARAAEIEARLAEIDDRANTHVRRDHHKRLADRIDVTIKERLLSASGREFVSAGVGGAFLASLLVGGTFFELQQIQAVYQVLREAPAAQNNAVASSVVSTMGSELLLHQVRLGLLWVGVGVIATYLLRQFFRRYNQVSRWELDLHRHRLDIERASMLVEADLEARKVNQQGLPDIMLQSFSRGLFSSSPDGKGHDEDGMGETLTALFGNAAKVQLSNNGMQVELDRRGIKAAEKQAGAGRDGD
jgi:hypothetical protein